MCTVSFIPRSRGYGIAMNRDERLTRVTALPPAQHRLGNRNVLFPSEPGGGTWIGLNDAGVCLALINWYSVPKHVADETISRGMVAKSALEADTLGVVDQIIASLPLARVNPFRVIGIFPGPQKVIEWRWNLEQLGRREHPWKTNIWISSGFDEPGAQQTRGKVFTTALRQHSHGSLAWLRRLHRSHKSDRGPYSICMHRNDAATVSYTEAVVNSSQATMRYQAGAPCCAMKASVHRLNLKG
ncbi:MAG: hypothetical protein JWR19_4051 [Pedosphaera sp.]|nr:hypothetical protein [Pedosphaera sp.]